VFWRRQAFISSADTKRRNRPRCCGGLEPLRKPLRAIWWSLLSRAYWSANPCLVPWSRRVYRFVQWWRLVGCRTPLVAVDQWHKPSTTADDAGIRGDGLSRGESLAFSCILQPLQIIYAEFARAHWHAHKASPAPSACNTSSMLSTEGGLIQIAEGKTKAARRFLLMVPEASMLLWRRAMPTRSNREGWVFPAGVADAIERASEVSQVATKLGTLWRCCQKAKAAQRPQVQLRLRIRWRALRDSNSRPTDS